MAAGLKCTRQEGETWREAVARMSGRYGLQRECLETYDAEAGHDDDADAAWVALYEWDCLELASE